MKQHNDKRMKQKQRPGPLLPSRDHSQSRPLWRKKKRTEKIVERKNAVQIVRGATLA